VTGRGCCWRKLAGETGLQFGALIVELKERKVGLICLTKDGVLESCRSLAWMRMDLQTGCTGSCCRISTVLGSFVRKRRCGGYRAVFGRYFLARRDFQTEEKERKRLDKARKSGASADKRADRLDLQSELRLVNN